MSAQTAPIPLSLGGRGLRLLSLGRAEMILLLRNRAALTTALVLPLGSLWLMHSATPTSVDAGEGERIAAGPLLATGTIGMVLLVVIYSTLVSAYVARREGMVLKRLRTGELVDVEILIGTALPTLAVAAVQCVAVTVIGIVAMDVRPPTNPVLFVAGILVGMALAAALAACSSVLTPTVEMAQLTVMPLLLASLAGSGLMIPLSAMPSWLEEVCGFLPMTPVVETIRAGWLGSGSEGLADGGWGPGLRHLGTAVAWTVAATWGARSWFRWEPRR